MQEYINKHPQRIDKFKLALWNLVQWDSAGLQVQFYIPDNGTVEAYDNEDPDEVGLQVQFYIPDNEIRQ